MFILYDILIILSNVRLNYFSAVPEIVQAPESIGIDIETNGSLPCQAIGRPLPKLSWRRGDGKPIDLNGRIKQLPSGSLEITSMLAIYLYVLLPCSFIYNFNYNNCVSSYRR
jgi:hypothetical protein